MKDDVKRCVDMRVNFFEEYYTVPEEILGEKDEFVRTINALGEECENSAVFEERFLQSGLYESFNGIIVRCVPKRRRLTKEEKAQTKKAVKQMLAENKGQIAKEILSDVADAAKTEAQSEILKKSREKMIEDDTYGEYTRTKNKIEDAAGLAGFLFKKFKK